MGKSSKYELIKRFHSIRNNYSGSITVEAAFVMPIVILTVFALIYLAFYLHDMNRIQSEMDLVLHKAEVTVKHEADISTGRVDYEDINDRGVFYLLVGNTSGEEEQMKAYLWQRLSSGLFLTRISQIDADVGKLKLTVSVETATRVSLPGIKYLFENIAGKILTKECSIHNPAEAIRCTEVILKTGSSIKGVDKIKEKFEKIFGSNQH
jgi:hypothetical protein